jgi:hypothetical protein
MIAKFDELVKDLTWDEKEELSMGLLYEISEHLNEHAGTKSIGSALWMLMSKCREAYRTAKLIDPNL